MINNFEIVKFEMSHAADAAEVEKASFSQPWSEQSLLSQLERDDSCMFAAICGGKAVGWSGMEHSFGEGSVLNIAVLPEYRRLGIGEALTAALVQKSRELKLDWLMLEVRPSNTAAVTLYKKLGFAEIGRRPNFYSFPREDALLLRIDFV